MSDPIFTDNDTWLAVREVKRLTARVAELEVALRECVETIEEDRDSVRDSETVPGHEYDPDDASPICRDLVTGYDAVLDRARAALAGGMK